MSALSSIEWTDRTWNPVRGCSLVSPGCVNCYAMKFAHRFSGAGKPYEGLTKQTKAGPQWTGKVRLVDEALTEPLRWKKPSRIFVNSMSDLFHEGVPDKFIDRVFAVMEQAKRHTFQILTKRPERMLEYFHRVTGPIPGLTPDRLFDWPLPNVWLGVSCEDQQRADERIPVLLQTPAAVRFISAEPLLGPIDIRFGKGATKWLRVPGPPDPPFVGPRWNRQRVEPKPLLDWVIVGGESGPGARPCEVAWVRSIVQHCQWASTPVFVKQLGAKMRGWCAAALHGGPEQIEEALENPDHCDSESAGESAACNSCGHTCVAVRDRAKLGDPAEWPAYLRVRQFPAVEARP